MADDDPFEGLLGKLTTEEGKKDLVGEEIERDEGTRVNSVERTSTGYLVLAEPGPEGGSGSGGGGSSDYVATHQEEIYWRDKRYRWDMDLAVLGQTPARKAEGISVIKKAFAKYGVD
jgi:hypothetical protein